MQNGSELPISVPPSVRRRTIVMGLPASPDPLQATQIEKQLKELFPNHDVILLGGMVGMMEVDR